ncbi:MAG: alpha/beta fold hydrolase [Pseudomonadales bacterium]|nr:alpha/beta fold hydrolase [Pseudomonadales bacterium]
MQTQSSEFQVEGTTLRGVFHLPENTDTKNGHQLPIVIMANGYATEWQFGTAEFIKAFTEAGIATFNFDYRSFGQSDGEPRQMVDIPGQLIDFHHAIENVKNQAWVDGQKLILWGSSLGGGHAISMAAEHHEIKAMIAQVPHCCSRAAFKTVSLSAVFKGMSNAIADNLGSLFNRPPIYLPILAEPSEYGVMHHAGWKKSYEVIGDGSPTWKNQLVARSLLKGGDYRPTMVADKIQCPSLLVPAEDDAGVPLDSVKETANKMKQAEIFSIPGDHFGVYYGEYLPRVIEKQLGFIQKHIA